MPSIGGRALRKSELDEILFHLSAPARACPAKRAAAARDLSRRCRHRPLSRTETIAREPAFPVTRISCGVLRTDSRLEVHEYLTPHRV
jgi:hypothetical protein